MKILAADTSCDESCVAIVDTEARRLVADVVHSHVGEMSRYGGVVPEIASREHLKALPLALNEALSRSGLTLSQIDHFAVTNRPGLIGALLVGVSYIKALAYAEKKPFSVLDHIEAHLHSPLLAQWDPQTASAPPPPPFPWIALVVSGGHSEIYKVEGPGRTQWLGGTLDDAAGEAFDKIGKLLGLPYPAGPTIDRWVREKASDADRTRFSFPRAQLAGFDLSFSGLKTAVNLQIQKLRPLLSEADRLAIAASAQEAILQPLVERARAALRAHSVSTWVVTGGVACNSRLRALAPEAIFPAPRHCTDNTAMVAVLAAIRAEQGRLTVAPWTVTASPHLLESAS